MDMLSNLLRILAPAIVLVVGVLARRPERVHDRSRGLWVSFGFPALAGFIIMWFRLKNSFKTFGKSVAWLLSIMLLSVLGSWVSGLEGLICITVALIPILFGTLLGAFYISAMTVEKLPEHAERCEPADTGHCSGRRHTRKSRSLSNLQQHTDRCSARCCISDVEIHPDISPDEGICAPPICWACSNPPQRFGKRGKRCGAAFLLER